jgi:hypothetical protein
MHGDYQTGAQCTETTLFHRELHTIVLDWLAKCMHGDYFFLIVIYIPLSKIGTKSPCTEYDFFPS